MFDILFSINSKPAHILKNEYDLNEHDKSYIREHFWPILIDNKVNVDKFKISLNQLKQKFIDDYKVFDSDLFKRNYLDSCLYHLKEMKNAMSKGKFRVWDIIKEDYFHRFDLKTDTPNAQTLIISHKDEIGLEIFINQIISAINEFLDENNIEEKRIKESSLIVTEPLHEEIESYFCFLLKVDPRKGKKILSEDDYNKLIKWIYFYFKNNFELPEINDPILEVNTNKTNIAFSFKKFFKKTHPANNYPQSLFNLYTKSFYQFRDDKFTNFKKTKEPEYFNTLIRKE